jgi:hypothetical protein
MFPTTYSYLFSHLLIATTVLDYPAMQKYMKHDHPAVCTICWKDPNKSASVSIFSTTNWNPSNLLIHLLKQHSPDEVPLLYSESPVTGQTKHRGKPGGGLFGTQAQSQLTSFAVPERDRVIPEAQFLLYKFFNMSNVAMEQASSPYLQRFIHHVIDNASYLKERKREISFSKYKFKNCELKFFGSFVETVKSMVSSAREAYSKEFSLPTVPFLNISHDGWDSVDHHVLGVSIHFIKPSSWIEVSLAVGLQRVNSKKSADMVIAISNILNR